MFRLIVVLAFSACSCLSEVSAVPMTGREILNHTNSKLGPGNVYSEKVGVLAKEYVGVTNFMTYIDFIEFCHKNNMQPAEVTSKEENDALSRYLNNFPDPKYFWLGGSDIGREGRYYWITSLQEFSFSSWGAGYPNGGREENCATVYGGDGSWFDQICSNDQIWPICQITTRT